jgi:predicted alpha/beta-fold hydrolase
MRFNTSGFSAPRWLKNPHLQTLWASRLRKAKALPRHREHLVLPDGDFIDLDWQNQGQGPIVIILHGLTGSSHSNYVLGLQHSLQQQGWSSVAMNFRGCSGKQNNVAYSYHSGQTTDFGAVLQQVQTKFPNTPIFATGYSLGGNVLLKWLGETQSKGQLVAAVAVSVPLLLELCSERIQQGFSRIYERHFLKQLQSSIATKKKHLKRLGHRQQLHLLEQLDTNRPIKTLKDFDQQITAPLNGFISAQDYYRRSSSRPYLKNIRTPTLIIQALDDPFIPTHAIPGKRELSPYVQLEISKHGGHVGFVSGSPLRPKYWLEQRIPEFFVSQLKQSTKPDVRPS